MDHAYCTVDGLYVYLYRIVSTGPDTLRCSHHSWVDVCSDEPYFSFRTCYKCYTTQRPSLPRCLAIDCGALMSPSFRTCYTTPHGYSSKHCHSRRELSDGKSARPRNGRARATRERQSASRRVRILQLACNAIRTRCRWSNDKAARSGRGTMRRRLLLHVPGPQPISP